METGFAFLLLIGSGLMIRSLVRLQQEDHGFRPDHVLTLRVPVGTLTQPRPTGKYDTRPRQMAYYREILERVRTVPGVKAAAIVNNPPLSGVNSSLDMHLPSPGGQSQPTLARTISPQYFAAMGVPLIAGRAFADSDVSGAPGVAIINEYLARQLFPDRNPLGEKLTGEANPSGPTVVGVVRSSSQSSYEVAPVGEVYIPYQQFIFATFMSTVVVRTEGEPKALAEGLRKQVWAVDANQPVVKVETMEEVVANSIWRPRFSVWIFSVLGGLAVLLTAIGVYAVVAYTSTLRAREVGIRVALGATASHVVGVILRGAIIPVATGLALSVLAALPPFASSHKPALRNQQQRPPDLSQCGRPPARDWSSRQRLPGLACGDTGPAADAARQNSGHTRPGLDLNLARSAAHHACVEPIFSSMGERSSPRSFQWSSL